MPGHGISARPGRAPCAHLGAEALKHVPQDVGLSSGQHQLTGGLCRHMSIAQDQRALHFVYVIITPVLSGGRGGQPASITQSAPSIPSYISHPTQEASHTSPKSLWKKVGLPATSEA